MNKKRKRKEKKERKKKRKKEREKKEREKKEREKKEERKKREIVFCFPSELGMLCAEPRERATRASDAAAGSINQLGQTPSNWYGTNISATPSMSFFCCFQILRRSYE